MATNTGTMVSSMTEARSLAEQDPQVKQLGGFVIASQGDEQFTYYAMSTPDGTLNDISGEQRLGSNIQIVGRYKWQGDRWERIGALDHTGEVEQVDKIKTNTG